jgi:hypothetical protein
MREYEDYKTKSEQEKLKAKKEVAKNYVSKIIRHKI